MYKVSTDDRLENAAEYGMMEIDLFLWKHAIDKLERNGLKVTKLFPSRKGEYYCKICWKDGKEGTQAYNLRKMALEAKSKI